ncbi:MAG: FAD-dependent monooxygenase [Acidobacteria bacterium]|nr:MAG: FAD-dependent monooxygenase [Acidobacteriota bacterium]
MKDTRYTVVGAGLAGSLMSILLARQGGQVRVVERRSDPRSGLEMAGKSINLAISHRGLHALEQVGLRQEIMDQATPMRGRMIHATGGALIFQPYGTRAGHAIYSVSRGALNRALIQAAGREPGVHLDFDCVCRDVDLDSATVTVQDRSVQEVRQLQADAIVGADGAFSAVRSRMQRTDRFDYQQSYLTHGYKELTIPAATGGGFAMEPHALHIWPRGRFMMIALPNQDGSFTCTLFWPFTGDGCFDALNTSVQVMEFFGRVFPDAVSLIPDLAEQYLGHSINSLVTVRSRPWNHGGRVVLVGDACHAVVPFYGQGANASFEDCVLLDRAMRDHPGDRAGAFSAYSAERSPHTDALADLAIANFVEMRDATASRFFRGRKRLERVLHRLAPGLFIPLYSMVTFTSVPYGEAVRQARRQWRVVILLMALVCLPALMALIGILVFLVRGM